MKKEHRFFDKTLDNDLKLLTDYLLDIQNRTFSENIFSLSEEIFKEYKSHNLGALTQLGIEHYNIFTFTNPEIYHLKSALKELTIEACNYYDIDFDSQKYFIHGWVNMDQPTATGQLSVGVNPINDPTHFHDHSSGLGAPWFHGYYCVNAEPSSTFYQIDKDPEKIFENINKNNRAILSETGHPHGRDDWFFDQQRITIAYDITPLASLANAKPNLWMPL